MSISTDLSDDELDLQETIAIAFGDIARDDLEQLKTDFLHIIRLTYQHPNPDENTFLHAFAMACRMLQGDIPESLTRALYQVIVDAEFELERITNNHWVFVEFRLFPGNHRINEQVNLTPIMIPLRIAWDAFWLVQHLPYSALNTLKEVASFASIADFNQGSPFPLSGPTYQEYFLRYLKEQIRIDKPQSQADALLNFTYWLVSIEAITYTAAADLASDVLAQPFTAEAWAKRLARWADKVQRPRLDRRGRPAKSRQLMFWRSVHRSSS